MDPTSEPTRPLRIATTGLAVLLLALLAAVLVWRRRRRPTPIDEAPADEGPADETGLIRVAGHERSRR